MKKDYNTFVNKYEKLSNDFNEKVEKLKKSYSFMDVVNMVYEEYKNFCKKHLIDFKIFIYECYSNVINDFFDIYDYEEIYEYIINNYTFKKIEKEKEEIKLSDIEEFLNEYSNEFKDFLNIDYDCIVLENEKFYKIL